MSFPRYPKYKDSGVEWLGEVPEHWRTMQLRFLLLDGKDGIRIGPFGSSIKIEHLVSEGIKVYGQENVIYRDFEAGDRRITDGHFRELSEYEIRGGDVLVTMAGTAGRCQAVPDRVEKGIIDSHLVRMRFPTEGVHAPFIPHLIESAAYVVAQIQVAWRGTTMQGLNSTIIKHLAIAIPGLDEQRAISSVLDRETAKIDALIAEQQRLIELLQEKRQAVISHAVTKGLNPDAPMKDSGIEWLGEVPEHWEVWPLKRFGTSLDGRRIPLSTEERSYRQGEYPYYGASGIIDSVDTFLFDEDLVLVSEDGANLINRSTPIAFVATGRYWVNNHAHIFRPIDHNLAYWAERIEAEDLTPFVTGSAQPKFTAEALLNLRIAVPPTEAERAAIQNYFLQEMKAVGGLIEEAEHAVALLQERRSALISAAVTGQIDVRNYSSEGAAA